MKKSNKKKFSAITNEEQHNIEVATKHSRLVTIATKLIRKECKIVKSFKCQKIVQKMKTIRDEGRGDDLPTSSTSITSTSTVIISSTADIIGESTQAANTTSATDLRLAVPGTTTMIDEEEKCEVVSSPSDGDNKAAAKGSDNDNTSGSKRKIANLEERLRFTKEFDLDEAVSVCLTRLGLKQKPQQQDINIEADHRQPIGKAHGTSHDSNIKNDNRDDSASGTNTCLSTTHDSSKTNQENDIKNANTITVRVCDVDNEKIQDQQAKHQFNTSLIESMLQHKRIVSVVKSINEKISEYSAWLSQREERLSLSSGDKDKRGTNMNNKNKRTKLNNKGDGMRRGGDVDVLGHGGNSGLFIDSLSGSINSNVVGGHDQEFIGVSHHDYSDEDFPEEPPLQSKKKQNRQGQRARKAKAMAIEARKAGHVWHQSVNWRKPKTNINEEGEEQRRAKTGDGRGDKKGNSSGYNSLTKKTVSASGLDISKNVKVSDVAMMDGKNWKEDGNAHPSWAAREAQKSKSSGVGVVQFTGTKITFD